MQHCGFSDQSRLAKRHFSSFLWIDNSSYIPSTRSFSLGLALALVLALAHSRTLALALSQPGIPFHASYTRRTYLLSPSRFAFK